MLPDGELTNRPLSAKSPQGVALPPSRVRSSEGLDLARASAGVGGKLWRQQRFPVRRCGVEEPDDRHRRLLPRTAHGHATAAPRRERNELAPAPSAFALNETRSARPKNGKIQGLCSAPVLSSILGNPVWFNSNAR
jgi:hypothetical protein